MSEPVMDFNACEHPWDRKYAVNGRGIVCLDCDTDTFVVRWDEPGANPLGDLGDWLRIGRESLPGGSLYSLDPEEQA